MSGVLTVGAGSPPAGADGEGVIRSSRGRRLARGARVSLPVVPFLVYVALGLLLPTLAIINYAFRTNSGRLTLFSNIKTITSNSPLTKEYLVGFETSLKLAVVCAVIPAVLGTILAWRHRRVPRRPTVKRLVASVSGVLANFGGVNLAFMFVASFAAANGVVTGWLNRIGLDPWNHGFNLYKFWGVAFVYMYFQIPLMVLIITPALAGLRPAWREAAENLGASSWQYWRHVGIPVLMPAVLGSTFLLFGSAFSAYATAEALTLGTIALTPIQIGAILQGNVLAGETNIAYALAFAMIVILMVSVVAYGLLRRRTSRWLR